MEVEWKSNDNDGISTTLWRLEFIKWVNFVLVISWLWDRFVRFVCVLLWLGDTGFFCVSLSRVQGDIFTFSFVQPTAKNPKTQILQQKSDKSTTSGAFWSFLHVKGKVKLSRKQFKHKEQKEKEY